MSELGRLIGILAATCLTLSTPVYAEGAEVWHPDPATLPWMPNLIEGVDLAVCDHVSDLYRDSFLITGDPSRLPDLTPLAFEPIPDAWLEAAPLEVKQFLSGSLAWRVSMLEHDFDGDGEIELAITYQVWSKVGSGIHLYIFESRNDFQEALLSSDVRSFLDKAALPLRNDGFQAFEASILGPTWFMDSPFLVVFELNGQPYFLGHAQTDEQRSNFDAAVFRYNTLGMMEAVCLIETSVALYDGPDSEVAALTHELHETLQRIRGERSCLWIEGSSQPKDLLRSLIVAPWPITSQQADARFRAVLDGLVPWSERSVGNWFVATRLDGLVEETTQALSDYLADRFDMNDAQARQFAESATRLYVAYPFTFGFMAEQDIAMPDTMEVRLNADSIGTELGNLKNSQTADPVELGLMLNRLLLRGDPFEAAPWLIEQGAAFDTSEEPTIMYAVEHPDLIDQMISFGADPDATNVFGKTAVMYAAQLGVLNTVKRLIAAGTDINTQTTKLFSSCAGSTNPNNDGLYDVKHVRTALDYAIQSGSQEMIDLLREHGAMTAEELGAENAVQH